MGVGILGRRYIQKHVRVPLAATDWMRVVDRGGEGAKPRHQSTHFSCLRRIIIKYLEPMVNIQCQPG
jgi:hypothetical protein